VCCQEIPDRRKGPDPAIVAAPEQKVVAVTSRAEVVDVGDGVTARGASRREITLRFYRAVILVGVVLIVASTF